MSQGTSGSSTSEAGFPKATHGRDRCPCITEGFVGPFCDVPVEHTCVNQCNGRGECYFGFCRCLDGWYGHDCAQRREGQPMTPGEGDLRLARPDFDSLFMLTVRTSMTPCYSSASECYLMCSHSRSSPCALLCLS